MGEEEEGLKGASKDLRARSKYEEGSSFNPVTRSANLGTRAVTSRELG